MVQTHLTHGVSAFKDNNLLMLNVNNHQITVQETVWVSSDTRTRTGNENCICFKMLIFFLGNND